MSELGQEYCKLCGFRNESGVFLGECPKCRGRIWGALPEAASSDTGVELIVAPISPAAKPSTRPTLSSVIRAAMDEFFNSKGGWDGDLEPVIAAVVRAVRSYLNHDFAIDVSKAVERELQRIMGGK